MNYEHILYAVDKGILTLTLNRPDKLNAFTHTMLRELLEALDKADADDDVRVIIVTGAGRGFCAGADLSAGAGSFNHAAEKDRNADTHRDGGGLLTLRLYESRKPVIAAINGAAVGVGVTMTLPMDIRLASTDARFGFVFARRGIVPEAASSWFLPRIVGVSQALQWSFSGKVFPAAEALQARLVSEVLAPEDLLPRARAIATEIVENTSAISVTMIRHMLWRMLSEDHPMAAHRIDSRSIYELGQTADAKEGVSSFLEKRPAQFPGKVSRDMPKFFPWWEPPKF